MFCCCPNPPSSLAFHPDQVHARAKPLDRSGMALVPAGQFRIGSASAEAHDADAEGPERLVDHSAFLIDNTAVTNSAFADFVAETGYVTEAERFGWSFVFYAQVHPKSASAVRPAPFGVPRWWVIVSDAHWRAPDGPGSDWRDRADHPVVHVSCRDAEAFARWLGKRLPSETEWEIAARGGLVGKRFPWGDTLTPDGIHRCNIWQGRFPRQNSGEDGWRATAPARSYPANGYGLFNMVGNTWEWTADPWHVDKPEIRAMRGGSYLCHESYCNRYRVSARTGNSLDATSSHLGFRCAADADFY